MSCAEWPRQSAKENRQGRSAVKTFLSSFGDERERSVLLHYVHHVFQRLRAYLARPCKRVIEDIDQKQDHRDRYRKRRCNQVLRPDVLHSEEVGVRNTGLE